MLDIVIPAYTISSELETMASDAVNSVKGQGRVIVVEDHGYYSSLLSELADIYIYCNRNVGFSANVNRGWEFSNADYTAIMSSDTTLEKGKLKDLCVPWKVTSPGIINQGITGLAGCFFVVPKVVKVVYGMLDESMTTYYSDEDYRNRTKGVFEKVDKVKIYHLQAQTVKAAGVEGDASADRKAFDKL